MTDALPSLLALGALAAALPRAIRARHALAGTTLLVPWAWGCAAWIGWTASAACDALVVATDRELVSAPTRDRLGYLAALLTLAALVAVLGARRPTDRVWSAFVVLPLLLVLGIPAVAAAGVFGPATPLRLETPLLLGYALVVAMGTGNYFGTRFTLSAVLGAGGLLLLGVRQAGLLADVLPLDVARALAAGLVATAVLVARRTRRAGGASPLVPARGVDVREDRSRDEGRGTRADDEGSRGEGRGSRAREDEEQTCGPLPRFDRLWNDVRDLFGIVWAKRLMDRVNDAAAQHAWPVRLGLDGFVPHDPSVPVVVEARVEAEIEHVLRWLLRRFADAEWIDARLPRTADAPGSVPPS
jgi:hypothetical protein